MEELSDDAKVVGYGFWGVIRASTVQFGKPNKIHPRAKAALDELVEKKFLTVGPINHLPESPIVYKPTDKMRLNPPQASAEMMKQNSFPMSVE